MSTLRRVWFRFSVRKIIQTLYPFLRNTASLTDDLLNWNARIKNAARMWGMGLSVLCFVWREVNSKFGTPEEAESRIPWVQSAARRLPMMFSWRDVTLTPPSASHSPNHPSPGVSLPTKSSLSWEPSRGGWLAEALSSLPVGFVPLRLTQPAGFISRLTQSFCILSI
jgi:hypothetical protein